MPGKNQVAEGQHECIDCIENHYSVDGKTCHIIQHKCQIKNTKCNYVQPMLALI